ncbi:MAG: sulfur carrier protein ThiS adenylyltransferase ThiF [Endomicrobiaceae bacterium]|nr:sulfur carrier protein ThiS adenylyltransferase ThiF [Endomicrobiaceae bacterium]
MNITLNGKLIHTECSSIYELKKSLSIENDNIVIINGFQTNQDYILSKNDSIVIIKKGVMPSKDEFESMISARHTPQVYNKLKQSKVAIAGLGGLGSNIAIMLARTGVGHLLLVDFDIVEPSNLNRQHYFARHLSMPKTSALEQQIKDINPFITIDTKTVYIDESNIKALFSEYEIVCEAFDNPISKAALVNTILTELPSIKIVAASGMAGYDSSNSIKTEKKMKNFYICGDFKNGAKIGNGLMSPRVQICAGHQANMIVRLLLGIEEV